MSVLPAPEEKATYVERMFARIADRYDRINRAMTFGLDTSWRWRAVELIAPVSSGPALDVGTGTGDFLPILAAWMPDGQAIGVDFTLRMMQAGQPIRDREAGQTAFVAGDALQLPFPDGTFDVITTGFVLRNVVDIPGALREMYRVARPGGRMACVEVARPEHMLLRVGHRFYFQYVVPVLAQALGGDRTAYTYLPQSAREFPAPPVLASLMTRAGWTRVRYELVGFGAAAIHVGCKPL